MKNFNIVCLMCLIFTMLTLTSCGAKDSSSTKETTTASLETTTTILTDEENITNALLKHYETQFPQSNPINAVGFKMYLIEDLGNGTKKAYGYASYGEYTITNNDLVFDCGSGATQVALTFTSDSSSSSVDYEVLTDGDMKTDEFKKAFPESIMDKMTKRDMDDMSLIEQLQKDSAKKQYKYITGIDYTKEF